jgi:hypothetical protein
MKPALIVAIVLAFAIHLAPRCDAKEKPAEAAACSNEQHSSALAAVLAIAVYAHEQGSAFENGTPQNQAPNGYKPPEWVLPLVGIITVIVIGWQSWETRKAAQATQRSAGTMENQTGILKQSVAQAKIAAQAAKDNAEALVNAERSWIMTELKWTADVEGERATTTRLTETVVVGDDKETWLDVCLICSNEGNSPAWIDRIDLWLKFASDLPEEPSEDSPTRSHTGPESVSVGKPRRFYFQPDCKGLRTGVGGVPLVLYVVVIYRDAFGDNHRTWCGYMVMGAKPRLERLSLTEYNKNT